MAASDSVNVDITSLPEGEQPCLFRQHWLGWLRRRIALAVRHRDALGEFAQRLKQLLDHVAHGGNVARGRPGMLGHLIKCLAIKKGLKLGSGPQFCAQGVQKIRRCRGNLGLQGSATYWIARELLGIV